MWKLPEIMNDIIIDLHGLNSDEASSRIRSALLSMEMDQFVSEIRFITGRGTGVLKFVLEEILDEENYSYQITNNGGEYIVYKIYDTDK